MTGPVAVDNIVLIVCSVVFSFGLSLYGAAICLFFDEALILYLEYFVRRILVIQNNNNNNNNNNNKKK